MARKKQNEIIFKDDYAIFIIESPPKGRIECLVDLETVDMLKNFYWYLKFDNRHPNCAGYVETRVNNKRVFMHLLIMPRPFNMVVDHINGNPFDNRKSNLRICKQSENCRNNHKAKNVYYNKRDNLYTVQFSINRKPKYLCYTRDYEEAEKYAKLGRQLLLENRVDELLAMPCKCILHSYHRQSNV